MTQRLEKLLEEIQDPIVRAILRGTGDHAAMAQAMVDPSLEVLAQKFVDKERAAARVSADEVERDRSEQP